MRSCSDRTRRSGSSGSPPPSGWIKDEDKGFWTPKEGLSAGVFFVWGEPRAAADEPLEKQFARYWKKEEGVFEELERSPARTVTLPAGLPAVAVDRQIRHLKNKLVLHSRSILFLHERETYGLTLCGTSKDAFTKASAREFKALFESVRADAAPVEFGRIVFRLPSRWKPGEAPRQWKLFESKQQVGLLVWTGPVRASDEPIAEQFGRFRGWEGEFEQVQAQDPEKLEVGRGLKAVGDGPRAEAQVRSEDRPVRLRGAGAGGWAAPRPPGGDRYQAEAEGRFGDQTFKGMSIDGEIEGSYYEGNRYAFYKPPGEGK